MVWFEHYVSRALNLPIGCFPLASSGIEAALGSLLRPDTEQDTDRHKIYQPRPNSHYLNE
jgi:hypothetical protein